MRWGPALFVNCSLTLKRLWGLEVLLWPLVKLWTPAPAHSALPQTQPVSMYVHMAASPFETARAQNSLDPIKSFCLSPILPSWSCCLFLLCVIHIHCVTTLLPSFLSIPQCISLRLLGRCFHGAEPCEFWVQKCTNVGIEPKAGKLS